MATTVIGPLSQEIPKLQSYEWPIAKKFEEFNESLNEFLGLDLDARHHRLAELRKDSEEHGKYINECLGQIYAYVYGYPNGPCYLTTDDDLEIKLQQAKILLERELMNWLELPPIPQKLGQFEAAQYLSEVIDNNTGVHHELFDYIATKASKVAILTFLFTETIRTEVVDDEVSFMTIGMQGPLKRSSASNLWDECGRGKLRDFHTYWLRMLLEETNTWEQFVNYRETMPWFVELTSNAFNMLLTRPGQKFAAYGFFILGESWVQPHFSKILDGMKRVGFDHEDDTIYFEKHANIDPYHTKELLDGFAYQKPQLTQAEVDQVLLGAQVMLTAATAQYNRMLPYLASP
jgi:hypothetical protein